MPNWTCRSNPPSMTRADDNVLLFPATDESPADQVWTCRNCGGQNWDLLPDGTVKCAKCDNISQLIGWYFYNPGDGAA